MIALELFGLCLFVVAMADRRAWPMLCVVGSVWWATTWSETTPDRLQGLAYRIGFDLVGAAFAASLSQGKTNRAAAWIFAPMLVSHATYWTARGYKTDLWWYYSNMLNGLWVLQLVVVALPGGRICGRVLSDLGARLLGGGRASVAGSGGVESARKVVP